MTEMKTLTIGGTTYEVVDDKAREDIKKMQEAEPTEGADGGHYTPSVVDNGDGTMTISFTASKEGMAAVNPITIALPVPADGKDGRDGQDGENGGYYTPTVETVTANTFKISFTASKTGMPAVGDVTITLPAAKDGEDGDDGVDGVGIESVVQTTTSTADGGENIITVTLTNGNKSTFTVKNGSKGNTGDAGADGKDGTNGTNGVDGVGIKSITKTSTSGLVDTYTITLTNNTTATFTVTNGKAGTNGTNGTNGKDGTSVTVSSVTESTESGGSNVVKFSDGKTVTIKNGKDGDPYTLTDTDLSTIVQAVIEALGGQPVAGYFDEDNNIVLTSTLPDGDYTVKYEMGENTYTLGTVTVKTTVNKYTVTFVADGVTVKVVEYEEGATSIDPNDVPAVPAKDGFTGVWDSYTLDDTNITVNAVYTENAPAVTTYGVTLNGTNCTSNGASSVNEGAAYTAKLTPSNGKNMIYTVSVKMGGTDITSSAYNSTTNTVSIAKVTGNVEITARAIKNLLPLAVDVDGNDYVGSHANGGDGWEYGIRVNSAGAEVALDGLYCTGFMPCTLSNKIRIKNVSEYTADSARNRIQFYNSSKSNTNGTTLLQANTYMAYKDGVYTINPSAFVTTADFFRFCCGSITADTIVTVDEEL